MIMDFIPWITNTLFLVLGFILGQLVQWKRRKVGGTAVAVPVVKLTPRRMDAILALGVVLTIILTLGASAHSQQQNKECMKELWTSLNVRSEVNDDLLESTRGLARSMATNGYLPETERREANRLAVEQYDRLAKQAAARLKANRVGEQDSC